MVAPQKFSHTIDFSNFCLKHNYDIKVYSMKDNELIEDNNKYFYHVVTNKPMYIGQKIIL